MPIELKIIPIQLEANGFVKPINEKNKTYQSILSTFYSTNLKEYETAYNGSDNIA